MMLIIDNYDSFTYNLVEYFKILKQKVKVARNDSITIPEIIDLKPEAIIISPGPCTPTEAGISKKVIRELKADFPILGICLGHQAAAEVFGAEIIKAVEPVHGKISEVVHDGRGVFEKLNTPLKVTRYHSLIVNRANLPEELEISAQTRQGEIMGIRHKYYSVIGVQFHPEAVLTEQGLKLLDNFLKVGKNNDS
jgi:anthranilate synthase/aminodeoxychorismate synthase-like glutamine amidotransferase